MHLLRAAKSTLVILLGVLCACASQPTAANDTALQSQLEALVAGFAGEVGIYVRHLGSGSVAAIRADVAFPTASLIKIPILIGIFAKLERGELEWSKPLVWDKARAYDQDDLLARVDTGTPIELGKLLHLMCAFSDNTASLWLQELAGTGTAINEWLSTHGFAVTRVNSRTPGREAAKQAFGWGTTTPREMAELIAKIRQGEVVSPAASERMYRTLCKTLWDHEAVSEVPPFVLAASKQGAVNASRSEVVLVHAPSGDYVFCLITKGQKDQSWKHDNAGFVLLRATQRLLWQHFEPSTPWSPATGSERYW